MWGAVGLGRLAVEAPPPPLLPLQIPNTQSLSGESRALPLHIDVPLHCPPTRPTTPLTPPPYLHIDKPKSSFLSWTYPHLSPETPILVITSLFRD